MTSLLRRNRPITAWSSQPKNRVEAGTGRESSSGRAIVSPILMGLLGLTVSVWSSWANAGDTPQRGYAVKTVSCSSDQSNSKLKWVPYRSPRVVADSQVMPAGGTTGLNEAPAASQDGAALKLAPEAESNSLQPFADKVAPKADSQGLKRVDPPALRLAEPLGDKALQKAPAETMPGRVLPPFRTEEVVPRLRSQSEGIAIPPLSSKPIEDTCPTLEELNLKPIRQITNDVAPKDGKFPFECPLKRETYEPRSWPVLTYTWKASGMCHKPLYFEEAQLERYGHSLPSYVQPVASAAHFFLVVPALPYFMGVYPPNECIYTLGYYRPGSCAPYMLDPFPISVRGALFETAAWTGAAFVIP